MGLARVNAPKRILGKVEGTLMERDGSLHRNRVTKAYEDEGNDIF